MHEEFTMKAIEQLKVYIQNYGFFYCNDIHMLYDSAN